MSWSGEGKAAAASGPALCQEQARAMHEAIRFLMVGKRDAARDELRTVFNAERAETVLRQMIDALSC